MDLDEFILNFARELGINFQEFEEIKILKFARGIIQNQFGINERCVQELFNGLDDLEKYQKKEEIRKILEGD